MIDLNNLKLLDIPAWPLPKVNPVFAGGLVTSDAGVLKGFPPQPAPEREGAPLPMVQQRMVFFGLVQATRPDLQTRSDQTPSFLHASSMEMPFIVLPGASEFLLNCLPAAGFPDKQEQNKGSGDPYQHQCKSSAIGIDAVDANACRHTS
jgi:hypothetical protein